MYYRMVNYITKHGEQNEISKECFFGGGASEFLNIFKWQFYKAPGLWSSVWFLHTVLLIPLFAVTCRSGPTSGLGRDSWRVALRSCSYAGGGQTPTELRATERERTQDGPPEELLCLQTRWSLPPGACCAAPPCCCPTCWARTTSVPGILSSWQHRASLRPEAMVDPRSGPWIQQVSF